MNGLKFTNLKTFYKMSAISESNVQCETIQQLLVDDFEACLTPMEAMPSLEAILATQKQAGIAQSVSDGSGKLKTVKVTYDQRALESAVVSETADRVCTSSNETYNAYTTYSIDPQHHLTYGEKFKISELATVCQEPAAFYAKKIAKVIDVLERAVATQTANELVTLTGKWGTSVSGTVNGSDELVLAQYVSAATKVIDYSSMVTLDNALVQSGYCAPSIIVGGTALSDYMKFSNHGCCAAAGADILSIANDFGKVVLYDKRVKAALGSELKSIAFQAGSLALITYNEFNANEIISAGSNYAQFKVNSPRTGLPIDIIIKLDCGVVNIVGYATTKLVGLPSDMFAVGDEFRGVKFVNKILVTNPA